MENNCSCGRGGQKEYRCVDIKCEKNQNQTLYCELCKEDHNHKHIRIENFAIYTELTEKWIFLKL